MLREILTPQMIRTLLRHFSRGVVLRRRLPKEFGGVPILVSPDSALGYWRRDLGKVDPFLLSMARELVRPGMVVWDIGANVGMFSFAAAALGAKVIAVEADLWLAQLLQRSAALNHLPVTVIPAAVADQSGFTTLHISPNGRSSNSVLGDGPAQTVVSITLDSMLTSFPGPSVIKIDVEGMEYAVLRGAMATLNVGAKLFCEITQHHEEIGELLTKAGYVFYAARARERQPLRRPSLDTLAEPRTAQRVVARGETAG